MPTDTPPKSRPLFRTLTQPGDATGPQVALTFDGRPIQAPAGCTVAAALLASGVSAFRTTPVSGAARAPFCMMGACFDCLVEIDGVPNRQSCLIAVAPGMKVRTQQGLRSFDLPEAGATEATHAG